MVWLIFGAVLLGSCAHNSSETGAKSSTNGQAGKTLGANLVPPVAQKQDVKLTKHNDNRVDSYFWLKERNDPKVLTHLQLENKYTDAVFKPHEPLIENLFGLLRSRVKEDISEVPYKWGEFYYYDRYEKGQEYPIYCRKKGSLSAKEEILVDVNQLGRGHKFFSMSSPDMSFDHKKMAYATDNVGRRQYTLHIRDITTGKDLPDKVENISGETAWAQDNSTIFYTTKDPVTLRVSKVFRFRLGAAAPPTLVYEEKDETFALSLQTSLTNEYLFVVSGSTLTSEVRVISLKEPEAAPKVFLPRQKGHEYFVDHGHDAFYVQSDDKAPNRKIFRVPLKDWRRSQWQVWVPHRADTYISNLIVLQDKVVLLERHNGLDGLRILDKKSQPAVASARPAISAATGTDGKPLVRGSTKSSIGGFVVPFSDPAYSVSFGVNMEYQSSQFRYDFQSPRQPLTTFDLDLSANTSTLIKTREVPNFNPDLYKVSRIWVKARDGEQIPVTILGKKDTKLDGSNPLMLWGYGSYGYSVDPVFRVSALSLVDRGFLYAIPHVRGGGELGRRWYDAGRTGKKMNTFYDFIDVTEALIKQKWADPQRIYAMGGSAGGLLMGAILNLRPDLYAGVIASVPFVDVLTTMLDDTIPLTTMEYDEWGNPNIKKDYDLIRSYSPYDNVQAKAYPHVFVPTGFHDSQVQYWEPAKWVAKLRELKTNDSLILLKTNMEAGHGGKSGRLERLRDTAIEQAFVLMIDQTRRPQ